MGGKRGRVACGGQRGYGGEGEPLDWEPWRDPTGRGEAKGTACQRLWRERGLRGEGQESGILLPTATGPESPQAPLGPSQHSAEKRGRRPWTVPPAQPVPGERSSSHELELGPKALTPLLSRKARPEGFVKSNKDSKQGFFFF